jgi:Ser/Thr protein kinase RdoA (MazF antagonist)
MSDHSFHNLTPEIILRAAERFGVVCTGGIFQLNSMENRVYQLEVETESADLPATSSERFRVIKFYRPSRWTKDQILEEHQFLLDLQEVEIPVVAPIVNEEKQTLLTCDTTGFFFTLFPRQGGRVPDEPSHEQAEQLGRLMARVHAIGAQKAAPHRLQLSPEVYGQQNLEFLLTQNLVAAELRGAYEKVVQDLIAKMTPLFKGVPFQRIHGDCHLGNCIWGTNGPFLVDFDDMVQGPPIQDLWLMLPARDLETRATFESILSGYEMMRHFDRSTLRLIEPLRALRIIHFNAWIGKRWEDPAFKRVFVHYGTPQYWNEQVQDLREQLGTISEIS